MAAIRTQVAAQQPLFAGEVWAAETAETRWRRRGARLVIGVDEAGRGPLAGPVVAAAVALNPDAPIAGLADSKALRPAEREALYAEIAGRALDFAVAESSAEEVDAINIRQATLRAMEQAVVVLVHKLGRDHGIAAPQVVLIDGRDTVQIPWHQEAVVRGDATCPSISAASIIAKVTRDRFMTQMDEVYPQYGFASHKGYGSAAHLEALRFHGPCALHRRTFRGVML